MNKKIITFEANEQSLIKTGGISNYSSNKVSYIEAEFELGENWQGFDAVRAIWYNKSEIIATVLSDGHCTVPYEVLTDKGQVKVNLVGSISENDVLTDRLTSYPVVAFIVDAEAKVNGSNTQPITPSQFEQFVEAVKEDADRAEQGASDAETYANNAETSADNALSYSQNAEGSAIRASGYVLDAQGYAQNAETAKDEAEDARDEILGMSANATTLPAGSSATASYSDGVLSLGIPQGIQGEKGDNGDTGATPSFSIGTVETLEPTESATATITGTDENPVLNLGLPKGEQGEVSFDELSALLPTDTASGSIASFPDGTDLFSALSVKAQIEPIQSGSGTPSPDNIRPISGHTECVTSVSGVNVWDEEWVYSGGSVRSANRIPLQPNTTYFFVAPTGSEWANVYCNDADGNNTVLGSPGYPFTTTSDTVYGIIATGGAYGTTYKHDISINYPSTDHDYHAHDGNTYTTTLGRTVYGGTLDVVSGELVVDRAMVDLGSLSWVYEQGRDLFEALLVPRAKSLFDAVCSNYPFVGSYSVLVDKSCGYIYGYHIAVKDSSYTDATTFKTAMNGVQLCYELATPQTYQLTPTEVDLLLGQNNVWTDCGAVEVTYKADIQRWVLKKLSE